MTATAGRSHPDCAGDRGHGAGHSREAGGRRVRCRRGLCAPSAFYGEVAKHSIDFWLSSEDIPLLDSRVTLRPDGVVRLVLRAGNSAEALARLRGTLQGMLGKLGVVNATFVRSPCPHKPLDHAATAHLAGTARFGSGPRTT